MMTVCINKFFDSLFMVSVLYTVDTKMQYAHAYIQHSHIENIHLHFNLHSYIYIHTHIHLHKLTHSHTYTHTYILCSLQIDNDILTQLHPCIYRIYCLRYRRHVQCQYKLMSLNTFIARNSAVSFQHNNSVSHCCTQNTNHMETLKRFAKI